MKAGVSGNSGACRKRRFSLTLEPAYSGLLLTIDLEGGIMPDLATREGHAQIAEECEQAELIVADNLSCLMRGNGKENEANTWTEAAEWALSMRSKGKAVPFVHHAGKDGARHVEARGFASREYQPQAGSNSHFGPEVFGLLRHSGIHAEMTGLRAKLRIAGKRAGFHTVAFNGSRLK